MLSMAVVLGLFFGYRWLRGQEAARKEDRELRVRELEAQREAQNSANGTTAAAPTSVGTGAGGYIILNLPDDQKSMFHDVLKGFEEFARLKGYTIQFSVDGSIPNQIAFKFTVGRGGLGVSEEQVEEDLKDYIARVQRGDDLSDLPIVTSDSVHAGLLLAMRNRISFLQHTYAAQRNALEFYERILRDGSNRGYGLAPSQNFYLQTGGEMTKSTYTAIGSQNVAQGKDIDASNNTVDQSIRIGESFNQRSDQLQSIEALIAALTKSPESDQVTRARVNLEKVKDEVANEAKPDTGRVKKWLETAQSALKAASLGKDVYELAKKAFDAFNLAS